MSQTTSLEKSIMFAIAAIGIAFSASGLIVGGMISTVSATHPSGHHDDSNKDNGAAAPQDAGAGPTTGDGSIGGNIGVGSGGGISSSGTEDVTTAQQQFATGQQASTNPACGQVVSGQVDLSANLNCSGDGIIVGGPNTVINMNGFSITGPGQDTSKVGIMVSNVDNVKVVGPGSISNFQAGVLLTGSNGFTVDSVIFSGNQIGTFMTGAENAQVQQNIIEGNSIGVASHSSTSTSIGSNLMDGNLLAGVTFVNTQQSEIGMNNIVGSQNGVFLDGQSRQNTVSANNAHQNVVDLNNANGLPTNINANQYVDNSCETSNPSGLCIGK